MTSHHVIYHVTAVTYLFIVKGNKKEKEKKNQRKEILNQEK